MRAIEQIQDIADIMKSIICRSDRHALQQLTRQQLQDLFEHALNEVMK